MEFEARKAVFRVTRPVFAVRCGPPLVSRTHKLFSGKVFIELTLGFSLVDVQNCGEIIRSGEIIEVPFQSGSQDGGQGEGASADV